VTRRSRIRKEKQEKKKKKKKKKRRRRRQLHTYCFLNPTWVNRHC
jgi:hypothetical protein